MGTVASTSELYLNPDGSDRGSEASATPSAPPPAPAPVVKPAEQTVTRVKIQPRMADEGKDGRIRDTSTDALRTGNDLGFREFDPDAKTDNPEEPKPPVQEAQPSSGDEPKSVSKTEAAPKLYAGKYKTVEDMEKAYAEANAALTRASQKAAELEKQVLAKASAPPEPRQFSQAELLAQEAARQEFLNKFVANPEGVVNEYVNRAAQQTVTALTTQEMIHNWRRDNPDLVPYEQEVGFKMNFIAQANPDLLKTPEGLRQLFTDSTTQFREFVGKLRTDGKKEALTVESRVIPLVQNTAPPTAPENPGKQAPLTADEAYNLHMRMMKDQERRSHRGLRR